MDGINIRVIHLTHLPLFLHIKILKTNMLFDYKKKKKAGYVQP